MNSEMALLNRDPYLILDPNGLVNIVLNEQYSQELSHHKRSYDYSYVSLNDNSPINTIGFTDLGIGNLINDFNSRKFKSEKKMVSFNFDIKSSEFIENPENLSIIPYIDTAQASEELLSSFASKIIKFIDGLKKEGLHGILVSLLENMKMVRR